MLWACLLEKAYAKAHGSYKSTSGGEIEEALLDLTGAPTLSVSFEAQGFDSELLWRSMKEWKRLGLPMGCATGGDDGELREMGLCGGHAYSVLGVREVVMRGEQTQTWGGGGEGELSLRRERLVHVRNPHGEGEWNGDWSAQSGKWASVLAAEGIERTAADDGTFWIDWTHFLMGFTVVECCLAYRGWHCRSFANAFPHRTSAWRVCEQLYHFEAPVAGRTSLYLMALQPSKRGAWCRADRKKSYRPGDVSILVARLSEDGRSVAAVVGGGLSGAAKNVTVALELEPGAAYLAVPYCLGASPTAAETTASQPFRVRFYASAPLAVTPRPFGGQRPEEQGLALAVLHEAVLNLAPPRPRASGWMAGEAALVGRLQRQLKQAGDACSVLLVRGNGVLAIVGANQSSAPVTIEVSAHTKSNSARAATGKLKSDTSAANAYYEKLKAAEARAKQAVAERQGGGGGGRLFKQRQAAQGGFRWPAKWQAFVVRSTVPPGQLRLLLLLVKSGVQATLGEVTARAVPAAEVLHESTGDDTSTPAVAASDTVQTSLHSWLGGAKNDKRKAKSTAPSVQTAGMLRDGIFASVPIQVQWLNTLNGGTGAGVGSAADCPGAHGLAQTQTPRFGFGCDCCGASLAAGVRVYCCRRCNHDVCERCFADAKGVPRAAGGPDAELVAALEASTHDPDGALAAALAASKHDADEELAAAVEASRRENHWKRGGGGGSGGGGGESASGGDEEGSFDTVSAVDRELTEAIAASKRENYWKGATRPRAEAAESKADVVELLSSDEEPSEAANAAPPTAAGASAQADWAAASAAFFQPGEVWACTRCTYGGNADTNLQCEVCGCSRVL
jgi:hypothetical protein